MQQKEKRNSLQLFKNAAWGETKQNSPIANLVLKKQKQNKFVAGKQLHDNKRIILKAKKSRIFLQFF
jgi:hypothetical protein